LKACATEYVKLNEKTQRAGTAHYHFVTERSLTGKRKLKAKCVANQSSAPSQQRLSQQKKPGSQCNAHGSQFPELQYYKGIRMDPRRSTIRTFPQLDLAILKTCISFNRDVQTTKPPTTLQYKTICLPTGYPQKQGSRTEPATVVKNSFLPHFQNLECFL
jgi:hypothetical protein